MWGFFSSVCFAYETGHFPTLHPHSLLIQKGPHFLPPKQAAHSAKGKSRDALGHRAWRRSLEKKPKPTNLTTKTPPDSPKKKKIEKEELPSVSKPAGRGATELVIMNLLLQTSPLGHGSALLGFTNFFRAAILLWPYSDPAQSCSSLCPSRNHRLEKPFHDG